MQKVEKSVLKNDEVQHSASMSVKDPKPHSLTSERATLNISTPSSAPTLQKTFRVKIVIPWLGLSTFPLGTGDIENPKRLGLDHWL